MHSAAIHNLKLVVAPFSNQEGEWFWRDSEMRELLAESKLYMIGQRREVYFRNFRGDENNETFYIDLESGDDALRGIEIPASQFGSEDAVLKFAIGPKLIKIFEIKPDGTEELVHWFTPDRLLFYYWRGQVVAKNLEDFRLFTLFRLYYVGISKKGDSFSRLFKTAHEGRSRILSNETQITPTARLSDELTLFLFKVEDLQIHSIRPGDEDVPDDFIDGFKVPIINMVADAEKAFVKILQTKYNTERYEAYPKGRDGLQSFGYDNYSFFIEEAVSFDSGKDTIKGAPTMFTTDPLAGPDAIIVRGGQVTLFKADSISSEREQPS